MSLDLLFVPAMELTNRKMQLILSAYALFSVPSKAVSDLYSVSNMVKLHWLVTSVSILAIGLQIGHTLSKYYH